MNGLMAGLLGDYNVHPDTVLEVSDAEGVECMKNINVKLAALYSELLGTICDILIASDGEISPDEIQEAQRIKSLLSDITSA